MPEQHMYFEEVNPERSQISSTDDAQHLFYEGSFSQMNSQKRAAQEKEKGLTAQQRSGFAIFSLILFTVIILFSQAMMNPLGSSLFAEIILITSIIIFSVIIILFNILFNVFYYIRNNEPSPKQSLIVSIISMILLITIFYSSVMSKISPSYLPHPIYAYLILILGNSLYLLVMIVVNVLFNSQRLKKNKWKEPH